MTHTLLLADDSITIQRVIELTLSGEDIEVISVGDGETALDRLRSERPDIVLADISMPKQNGYDVATYVRSEPRFAHVPVLLLAGAFETVDQARVEQIGCDGVLVKPFEPQQVVARVRELLARADADRRRASSPAAGPPAPVETEVPVSGAGASGDVQSPPNSTGPDAPGTASVGVDSGPPLAPEPAFGDWFTSESAADVPAAVAAAVDVPDPDVTPPASEAVPIEPAPFEPSAPQSVPTLAVPPAGVVSGGAPAPASDAFDDYFGRLGSAVEASAVPGRGPQVHAGVGTAFDDPWTYGDVPTLSGLLDPSSPGWPGVRFAAGAGSDARTRPRDAFTPEQLTEPADAGAERGSNAGGSFVAAAFHALLEAEQGRPRVVDPSPPPVAAPSALPSVSGPDISDELVERVTQRVMDRLVPNAAREMVASIVSNVAERLVREEMAKARARDEGRQ